MHIDNTCFDRELDARGMKFPLPIWKAEKALAEMAVDQVLKIVVTDCGMAKYMQQFAEQTGNTLLSKNEVNGMYIFYMQKNTASYRQSKSHFA